ncbi:MAG: ParB/RepB/Spo0J family partition protein [Paracoccaceae bacterium]
MTEKKQERRGLGRGLSALMADVGIESGLDRSPASAPPTGLRSVPIETVSPNPRQPRRHFDEEALRDLSSSIAEKGVLQPLVVRPTSRNPDLFEIVAGERRWRAAQMAQLSSVPVIVRDLSDSEVLEIAIIENIQREDLNAVEEAAGYKQLIDRFGHTQEKIASALGKSRSHIANLLRLLSLPDEVQSMIVDGSLSAGHARALITSADPVGLAKKVMAEGLSVRKTEELARHVADNHGGKRAPAPEKDADTRVLESDLSSNLGMQVVIDHRAGGEGIVTIRYKTIDQLDQLCQLLSSVR